MNNPLYVIDTGDSRMFHTMRAIKENGHRVCSYSSFSGEESAVYCYSPAKRFTKEELTRLNTNSALISGAMPNESITLLNERGIRHYNLLLDEVFAIENAIQTAEAALMLIIRATDISIFKTRIAIFGYGRLGRALANIFSSLGLDFAICTNDYYERAEAHISCRDVYDLSAPITDADVIVNTIPAKIFTFEKLVKVKKSCYILDLATFTAVENSHIQSLELNYDNALGLPGKYSPKSAGEIMAKAILNIKL